MPNITDEELKTIIERETKNIAMKQFALGFRAGLGTVREIYKKKKGNNTDSVVLNNVKNYCEKMILAVDSNKKVTNIPGNEGK